MNRKAASVGLGIFSIGIGIGQLLASRRIASALDAEGREGVIKGFGLRGIRTGVGLLRSPGQGAHIWERVNNDSMDLAALGLLAARAPRNRAVWGAIAFVGATTIADILLARALDAQEGESEAAAEKDAGESPTVKS